ncbi:hypothetical protein D3C73_636530 [compost metagenome]
MQYPAAVFIIVHIDEINDDDAAQVAQPQLAGNGLRRFDVGIEDGLVKIAVANKGPGVDIHGGHGFGLIDDQVTAGLQFNLALQRALDLVLDVVQIEDRLAAGIQLQLIGDIRDVLAGKFHQLVMRQA